MSASRASQRTVINLGRWHERIDLSSPVPLWAQLRAIVETHLIHDDCQPGDLLPNENEIIRAFGVSRATTRHTMTGLAADGWVVRRPGIGTVVATICPPAQKHSQSQTGLDDVLSAETGPDRPHPKAASSRSRGERVIGDAAVSPVRRTPRVPVGRPRSTRRRAICLSLGTDETADVYADELRRRLAALTDLSWRFRLVTLDQTDSLINGVRSHRSSALIVRAPESRSTIDDVESVIGSGLPVVTLGSDLPTTSRAGYAGVDGLSAGRTVGQHFFAAAARRQPARRSWLSRLRLDFASTRNSSRASAGPAETGGSAWWTSIRSTSAGSGDRSGRRPASKTGSSGCSRSAPAPVSSLRRSERWVSRLPAGSVSGNRTVTSPRCVSRVLATLWLRRRWTPKQRGHSGWSDAPSTTIRASCHHQHRSDSAGRRRDEHHLRCGRRGALTCRR